MKVNFDYIDVTALIGVFHTGVAQELDNSIGCYYEGHNDRVAYVYSNGRAIIRAMTVLAKQLCISRMTSGFAIRLTEGESAYCISFLFTTAKESPEYGSCDVLSHAPSLEISQNALEYAINTAKDSGFEICLTRKGTLGSFDFIFGKTDRLIPLGASVAHAKDFEYVSEEFFGVIDAF